jgi:hypothetical protein
VPMGLDAQGLDPRMYQREDAKSCIIYPENELKANWDVILTLLLVITCIMTPL